MVRAEPGLSVAQGANPGTSRPTHFAVGLLIHPSEVRHNEWISRWTTTGPA